MIVQANSKDKKIWNQFVSQSPMGNFLQSWEWGEFQKSQGRKVFRFFIKNQDRILGSYVIIYVK